MICFSALFHSVKPVYSGALSTQHAAYSEHFSDPATNIVIIMNIPKAAVWLQNSHAWVMLGAGTAELSKLTHTRNSPTAGDHKQNTFMPFTILHLSLANNRVMFYQTKSYNYYYYNNTRMHKCNGINLSQ